MTNTYYKFREDGRLLSTMHIDAAEAALQGNVTLETPQPPPDKWPWRVNGAWEYRLEQVAEPTPGQLRRQQYPPISEQLDMLWHAMDRGELPRAEGFYETIKEVKDAYPKAATVFEVGPMPAA